MNMPIGGLSRREKEVLLWIKDGKSTEDIAALMGITHRTVKFHVSSIMGKLNAASRAHAVAIAMEKRLLD